ncbi:MAG TPA: ABC transporter permease [Solirubrobacteraceae bacterium]|jgi:ribose transport system permease protein|nr:ABC transporter permease [Solirubrobacteraceae bacterium]
MSGATDAPIAPAGPPLPAGNSQRLTSVRGLAGRILSADTPSLQVLMLAILFAVAAITIDGFVTKSSIYSVIVLASFLGVAAIGQTIVILIGGLDLSVASVISAANLIMPALTGKGWSPALAILFVVVAGALVGAANGFIVRRWRVSPLIITLATGGIVYGIALATTNSGLAPANIPNWLSQFSSPIGKTFGIGIPPVVVLWIIVAVVIGVILRRTASGRRVYATGANERAADLAGVRTMRVWVGAFALSGGAAAVTGVLLVGFVDSASVGAGSQYLFTSLAAVVVGGTSLVGARGDYTRSVLGALILTLISTILIAHGAGSALQEAAYGFLILVFVGVYGRERRVRDQV